MDRTYTVSPGEYSSYRSVQLSVGASSISSSLWKSLGRVSVLDGRSYYSTLKYRVLPEHLSKFEEILQEAKFEKEGK